MIGKYYTLESQAVTKPPIQLNTKSIYKAIVIMERDFKMTVKRMNIKSRWCLFGNGNERLIMEW